MGILNKCFGGCGSTPQKKPSTTMEYLCHRFSLAQLRKSTDGFHKSRKFGEGPYGVSYRARISVNGELKDITVKRLRREAAISSNGISLYKKDIIFMCQLNHPNLISFIGFCEDKKEMIVVYDHIQNGSLYDEILARDSNSRTFSWKKRLEISIGVARGLHYIHSGTKRTMIHRNITPFTILLDKNWVPKLMFFGLSLKGPKFSAKDVKPKVLESVEGTMGYIAPECFISGTNVTYKSDVYSFGVILLELIRGKTLFRSNQHDQDRHHIKEGRNLAETGKAEEIIDESLVGEVAEECWEFYMDITRSCLSEDPEERPHMGEVEVQLERVLELQEEADIKHGFHSFLI